MVQRFQNMPVIARRGTLKVMMFYNDHSPPHVHVDGGEDYQVVVEILDPEIPPNIFPKPMRRDVLAWIKRRQTELLANWARAQAGVPLERVPFP